MKPFLSDKCSETSEVSLVHEGNIISDDLELTKTFKNFFETAMDDLEIKNMKVISILI